MVNTVWNAGRIYRRWTNAGLKFIDAAAALQGWIQYVIVMHAEDKSFFPAELEHGNVDRL